MGKRKIKILVVFHILFWVINYGIVGTGNLSWNGFDSKSGSLAIAYSYGLFFNIVIFYSQIFWFVPQFYIKHKKRKFWLYSFLLLLFITCIESGIDLIVIQKYNIYILEKVTLIGFVVLSVVYNGIFHLIYSFLGFLYRFQFEYFKSEKAKQVLLKETHQTELKYLKAQLNPHFLFNGINSVYHLIGANNELAKESLLQFSGLLRYQLYESNSTFIKLEKELNYVQEYIKLEELRKGADISLEYRLDFENEALKIAPLLLTPFIENAFKYVSNHNESSKNKIKISIIEKDKKLILKVANTFDKQYQTKTVGGVGLVNVKRRLELLYPDSHQLNIGKVNDEFLVDLKIDL